MEKKACIGLFIKTLCIMLSEFCPDICPWADIVVTLPVSMFWAKLIKRYYWFIVLYSVIKRHNSFFVINRHIARQVFILNDICFI